MTTEKTWDEMTREERKEATSRRKERRDAEKRQHFLDTMSKAMEQSAEEEAADKAQEIKEAKANLEAEMKAKQARAECRSTEFADVPDDDFKTWAHQLFKK